MTDQFRGYIWFEGGFHTSLPAGLFPDPLYPDDLPAALSRVDGCFSLILQREDHIFAAVDRIRSLPIFYAQRNNELLVSHSAANLRAELGLRNTDPDAEAEFLLTGYTTRSTTLFAAIKQLEAGQYLLWDKLTATLELRDYYLYRHSYAAPADPLEEMDAMHRELAGRLVASAEGRTIAIPLSGGFDSRLLAALLRRMGYDRVVCFTYGSPHQGEAERSRLVARFLNYPWIMLHHTRRMWYEAYHSPEMQHYFRACGQACASPHIQDWLAVKLLWERELVPRDTIFVPGHSGGCPQGANLPFNFGDKEELTAQDLLDAIYRKHYNLWPTSPEYRESRFAPLLREYLDIPAILQPEYAASLFDEWDWRQRQAKFIVNSVRVYEFFGYEWRLPLWDLGFMEFWRRVPLEQRLERALLRQYFLRYHDMPVSTYHNYPLPLRLRHKVQRIQSGNLYDLRYGRYLDYRDKESFRATTVGSLLSPDHAYPPYLEAGRTILRADLNAIQALDYLRGLWEGKY